MPTPTPRTLFRLTLFSLTLTVLAACAQLPTPADLFDTPLEPGATTVTEEGVYLGAPEGALEGPRAFSVEAVAMPSDTAGFPNADTLGAFIALDVEGDFETPEDAPLLLGLPVPAGADTGRLALAVLMPAETIHNDTQGLGENDPDPVVRDSWVLVPGAYDPEGERLVVALTELPVGGITSVVVASGAFGSPPVGASLEEQQGDFEFVARCVGFDDLGRADECTSADETFMTNELESAFLDLEALGFRPPKLALEYEFASLQPPSVSVRRYVAELHPFVTAGEDGDLCLVNDEGRGNHGRYTASLRRVAVCWGEPVATLRGTGYDGGRIDVLRHEYFHAIQYAYGDSATSWFKESTSVVAEDSLASMVRDTGRGVRDVDVQMNADAQKYNLQDFWVYLGMRFGIGLADLIPFLEAGGDAAALESVFASDYPALGGLDGAYWAWAKNQSFEKEFALGGNGFAVQCDLDTGGAGGTFALEGSVTPGALTFDHAAPDSDLVVGLPPLTSRVYQLVFPHGSSGGYSTTVTVSGGAEVRSKFYDPADRGSLACVGDPDSDSLPLTVTGAQDETRYLLVANSGATGDVDVTIRGPFAAVQGPAIAIVSPLQGAVFDENDFIDFRAIASGFTDSDPDLVTIRWSYERNGGIPTTFGTSESGKTISERLCDGSYRVTATALDAAAGGGSASASATFVVSDLGSSGNPPSACRPTITILEPSDGQTFAVGQTIALRAAITDDDPATDDPLYPVVWRDGGPSGSIIGMGLESSTKLGEGAHQLHVSYGVASDTVDITIGTGNPPTATITFPGDDLFIPWTDVPGCSDTLTLSGFGGDSEDGALSGEALTWRYRVNGGSQFLLGTGSPIDLGIVCGNTYEVTLTAEDSSGLQANDTVIITVGAPPS